MTALKRSREDVSADEGLLLPTLYGYWRSSASWRVRIACELKKIPYLYHPVNLLKGEDCSEAYLKINPMGQLPTWVQPTKEGEKDIIINQSMAILEYLDEAYPNTPQLVPALAPSSAPAAEKQAALLARAAVRDLALLIVSGIHPIQNISVLNKVEKLAGGGQPTKAAWAKEVITEGLEALEVALTDKNTLCGFITNTTTVESSGGAEGEGKTDGVVGGHHHKFCFGNTFTLVDACLIPQLYNAARFGVDMAKFPTISRIVESYKELDFLAAAHPEAMPDATA